MTKSHRAALATAALLAMAAGFGSARADEDRFSLHGFGNQDYSKTTENTFEQAGPTGTWENNFLGLVMSAKISDQSKLWAQFQANSVEEARVTWMFIDYQFTDNLSGQVGRVKFPFGIYNEYIDTRALQMSVGKPFAYSLEADMTYDAYQGLGINYALDLVRLGRLTIQGFGGDIFTPASPFVTPPFPEQFQMGNLEAVTNDLHVWGAKITWETPIEGLRFLLSANQTKIITTADNGQAPNQPGLENRWMLSADYVTDRLDLKAELNRHKYPGLSGFPDQNSYAWYVQAGFPIGKWTPYTRYDAVSTDMSQSSNPSYYQHTVVLGINRKLTPNLNLRVEDEFNHGYALPVAAGETMTGAGKSNWQLFAAQINFMF